MAVLPEDTVAGAADAADVGVEPLAAPAAVVAGDAAVVAEADPAEADVFLLEPQAERATASKSGAANNRRLRESMSWCSLACG
jgi:hypothetical protein